ncbi:MAG TPA: ferritin-like domain-containing protein [Candidatus Acidoferrum sp.]|jgi:ferritin-like metal-binding protein YciE|nr:ferritin-like domain-containing protein [Candidatus Acidoferrum sp.]
MTEKKSGLKNLLVEQLQDLLSAENQLVAALPKMADAANEPKLKEAFTNHLQQTRGHVDRLRNSLRLLGATGEAKICKAMKGIVEEGQETIDESEDKDELTADLALIAAAQRAEHYEISGYGNARCIAKQIGESEVALLLSHTLGEEEGADFLLTSITLPILQQATSKEFGNGTKAPWGEPGETSNTFLAPTKARVATASARPKLNIRKKS